MQQLIKRGLALLLVLAMFVGFVAICANAVTIDYVVGDPTPVKISDTAYTDVIANWGTRGTTATYLSQNAEAFYTEGNTYADFAALEGSSTDDATGSELYQALSEFMAHNHTEKTDYDSTRPLFAYTDCQNSDVDNLSTFYSNETVDSTWDSGNTYNREHVWPNSKDLYPNKDHSEDGDDIMMLRPEKSSNNSSRGNKAFGTTTNSDYYFPNQEANGNDVRGDVARIILYVHVRWQNPNIWGASGVMESLDVLLDWMEADPVDTWELGRNDSVESITGTRNVFVDYPELAFLLYNQPIPSDMPTPSGEAMNGSIDYTITAVSSNEAHGTVQVNGNIITATPAEGYAATGYEVTAGEATVTQRGNLFTVNAAADCTVKILFTPREVYTVTFLQAGVTTSSTDVYAGDYVVLPGYTGNVPADYTFLGWTDQPLTESTTKPAVMEVGERYTPTASTNLHALYSFGGATFELVTSSNQLTADSYVVIAAKNSNVALSTTQNGNNRGQAAITKNADNTITFGDNVEVLQLVVGASSGTYSFYDLDNNGYLTTASSSSNYLRTSSTKNANASWNITISSNTANIVGAGSYSRKYMQHNSNNSIFACYSSASQKPIQLYISSSLGETKYSTYTGCTHANAGLVNVATVSCTENGYTGDLYCADCQTTLHSGTPIAATAHKDAVFHEEVKATCKDEGTKAYYHCDECGKDFLEKAVDAVAQTTDDLKLPVDATNHVGGTTLKDQAAASCTTPGYTGDTWCLGCSTKIGDGTVIDPTAHKDATFVQATASTCKTHGVKAHYHCDTCGKDYLAKTADAVAQTVEDLKQALNPLNHEGTPELRGQKAATCTEDGYTGNSCCPGCDTVITAGQVIKAAGHKMGEFVVTKAPTATEKGVKTAVCATCGHTETQEVATVSTPNTGDSFQLGAIIATMIVSLAALVCLVPKKH